MTDSRQIEGMTSIIKLFIVVLPATPETSMNKNDVTKDIMIHSNWGKQVKQERCTYLK